MERKNLRTRERHTPESKIGLSAERLFALLPRVAASLIKFVTPVTTSAESSSLYTYIENSKDQKKKGDKGEKEKKKPQFNNPYQETESKKAGNHETYQEDHAKVVPIRQALSSEKAKPQAQSSNFVKVFSSIQEQRKPLIEWMGKKIYQSASESKRKATTKGTVLDILAD